MWTSLEVFENRRIQWPSPSCVSARVNFLLHKPIIANDREYTPVHNHKLDGDSNFFHDISNMYRKINKNIDFVEKTPFKIIIDTLGVTQYQVDSHPIDYLWQGILLINDKFSSIFS